MDQPVAKHFSLDNHSLSDLSVNATEMTFNSMKQEKTSGSVDSTAYRRMASTLEEVSELLSCSKCNTSEYSILGVI